MLTYYTTKLERISRKIDKIKDKSKSKELTVNEHTALLIAEAEKRLIEEFLDDIKEMDKYKQ